MPNLPFKAGTEIFRWGPIPGKFLYTSTFVEVNYKYFCQKYLGENWSETLFLFKDGRMVWINDYAALRASGEKVFVKFMLPVASREENYRDWKEAVARLTVIESEVAGQDLSNIDNNKLGDLWTRFHDIYREFWILGTVSELANYGAERYFESKLRAKVPNEALVRVLEALIAPERQSFYQEEEVALSKTKDLAAHRDKYFWLKNSYAGTQVLPQEFFAERKKNLLSSYEAQVEEAADRIKKKKRKIIDEFSLDTEIVAIGEAIVSGMELQDERKKYIFIALHHEDLILREVARRFDYDFDHLHHAWYYEIAEIIHGKDMRGELGKRNLGFGIHFYKSFCENLSPDLTNNYWDEYAEEKAISGKVLKGMVASSGKNAVVTGKVRVLLDPLKVEEFLEGEILVAPMTSPEYIFAMKKAAAIVTDAGGLTSHAAIVSRELGIPCIVGTRMATGLLKNGDKVEIDVNKGIIKKI